MANRWGKMETVTDFIFLVSKITVDDDCSHEIKRHLHLGRQAMTNLDHVLKRRHHFADKGPNSRSYGLSSCHVWMWELDQKEGWVPKNWYFWIVVLEKTLESPLGSKIKPVTPKGVQPWIQIGRTIAEAEALILWTLDVKSQLTGKDINAGKDWGQKKMDDAEDEMVV